MPTSDQWAALGTSVDLGMGAIASGGAQTFETGPALNGYNGAATIAGIESLQTPAVDLGALSGTGNFEVNQGFINGTSPYGEDFQNLSAAPVKVARASGAPGFSLLNLLGISTAYAETEDPDTSLVTSLPEPNPPLEENIAKLDLEVREAERDPSLEVDRADPAFLAQMRALLPSAPSPAEVFPSSLNSAFEPSPEAIEAVLGSPTRVGEYGPELVNPPSAPSTAEVSGTGAGSPEWFANVDQAIASLTAPANTEAIDEAGDTETPAWRLYEQRYGGQQTPMTTTFDGEDVNVRLDAPPSDSQIVDFKDYNWSNPAYEMPFIQGRVIESFQNQIELYQTIRPNVVLQFSQQPPQWAVNAIEQAGGSYSVKP